MIFLICVYTTENRIFAVCPRHTAKPKKYSAKALPNVTLGKQHTTYIVTAKVYFLSGTRQRRCRVLKPMLGKKKK